MSGPKWKAVRAAWLQEGGRRLDCNPYMSGALEARDVLRQLKVRKDALRTLTAGHAGVSTTGLFLLASGWMTPDTGCRFWAAATCSTRISRPCRCCNVNMPNQKSWLTWS